MPTIQLERISDINRLEGIRSEWTTLWERCPDATPFQSPEWILPWWRHLGGGELLAMGLWQDKELVGLAPLFIHEWMGRRQISPLGVSISDYTEFLLLPENAAEGAGLILDCLAELGEQWDICILPEVKQDSILLQASVDGLNKESEPSEVCPVLELASSEEAFEAGLSGHLLRNLRRGRNLLESLGGAKIETAHAETVSEFMDALFELHAARWKKQAEPGVLAAPQVKAFQREAADGLFKRGALKLYGLRRREGLASVMYDLVAHGVMYAYLGGFDPALERVSPGALLTFHAIQDAIRSGCREYDFLRGKEDHKYVWGAQDRANYRLVLSPA